MIKTLDWKEGYRDRNMYIACFQDTEVVLCTFNVILTYITPFSSSSLKCPVTSASSKSNLPAILKSADNMLATAGSGTNQQSTEVPLQCGVGKFMGEDSISESLTLGLFRLVQLCLSEQQLDVLEGSHNASHGPVCSTGGILTVRSMELGAFPEFNRQGCSGGFGMFVLLSTPVDRVH